MEKNDRLELARAIVTQTGTSLFLTGKAGTGKTTFLHELRDTCRKRMIVAAPTGIAAINAGGVTLHSFFQLDFGPYVPGMRKDGGDRRRMALSKEKIRMIRGLDLLVIDEISMVRADVLDAVDNTLRRLRDRTLPFGGVQLLMIGDLQQLPPVVTASERPLLEANYRSPYFFDSHALEQLDYVTVELEKVYRQNDAGFISLLNAVRSNQAGQDELHALNARCRPGFNPPDEDGYIRLTTHNHLADALNRRRMDSLPAPASCYEAVIEGAFPEGSYPAEKHLLLKPGAQVMFIKNDTGTDRRYFNGMLGLVTETDEESVTVSASDTGEEIKVVPAEWENIRYTIDEESKNITAEREGAFRQLPLRPAWAITIHKSQGLTFDRAIIDASGAFSHGQTYVALSRCRSLDGLVLEKPLSLLSIITDRTVTDFMTGHSACPGNEDITEMSRAYKLRLAEGIFRFQGLFNALEGVIRLLKENFQRLYPGQVRQLAEGAEDLRKNMTDVGDRFCVQLRHLSDRNDTTTFNSRINDACRYFSELMLKLHELTETIPMEHDNKTVKQKLKDRLDIFSDMEAIRTVLLEYFAEHDFDINIYHDIKAKGVFRPALKKTKKKATGTAEKVPAATEGEREPAAERTEDNPNPELFEQLRAWRRERAEAISVPAFTIASTRSLLGVAASIPLSRKELLDVPGIGPGTVARIGDDILRITHDYVSSKESREIVRIPVKKRKKERRRKGDSARESLALWREGMEPEKIAERRELALSTVTGHILDTADFDNPEERSRAIDAQTEKALRDFYDTDPELPRRHTERFEIVRAKTGLPLNRLQMLLVERDYPGLRLLDPELPEPEKP